METGEFGAQFIQRLLLPAPGLFKLAAERGQLLLRQRRFVFGGDEFVPVLLFFDFQFPEGVFEAGPLVLKALRGFEFVRAALELFRQLSGEFRGIGRTAFGSEAFRRRCCCGPQPDRLLVERTQFAGDRREPDLLLLQVRPDRFRTGAGCGRRRYSGMRMMGGAAERAGGTLPQRGAFGREVRDAVFGVEPGQLRFECGAGGGDLFLFRRKLVFPPRRFIELPEALRLLRREAGELFELEFADGQLQNRPGTGVGVAAKLLPFRPELLKPGLRLGKPLLQRIAALSKPGQRRFGLPDLPKLFSEERLIVFGRFQAVEPDRITFEAEILFRAGFEVGSDGGELAFRSGDFLPEELEFPVRLPFRRFPGAAGVGQLPEFLFAAQQSGVEQPRRGDGGTQDRKSVV